MARPAALLLLVTGAAAIGEPSLSPTNSPSGCPIQVDIDSVVPFQCDCLILDPTTPPFNDIGHTYCPGTMPAEWYGAYHFSCPHCFHLGTNFTIHCPNNWGGCHVFLLVYHCPNCTSSDFNGGWVQNLDQDWAPRHCAPNFCLAGDAQGAQHNMNSFNQQFGPGEPIGLPATTTSKSYYFSFIVKPIDMPCSDATSANCAATNSGGCVWDGSGCVPSFCPPGNGGGPGCGPPCPPEDCVDSLPPAPDTSSAPSTRVISGNRLPTKSPTVSPSGPAA
eukprot:TRINITY_DN2633_c0_g2_i1.p1 TRINITY_DN2633_c0_g2~~TRINITY_DN2633_c0_g2_i1.p1  ORF type:complete len:302 (+),score=92.62 TRINITY_DN2633_c0_g2_i1:79-906(+)